jgi:hypothetical protein
MAAEVIYRVFVSSTFEDLKAERAEVQKSLLRMKCLPIAMEQFPAANAGAWEFIKQQVEEADFYLIVVAGKYGSVADDGVSFTEKEYDYATTLNKPILTFMHCDPRQITAEYSEMDPNKIKKLDEFKEKCKSRTLVAFYKDPHSLGGEVLSSVIELKNKLEKSHDLGYVRIKDVLDYKRYSDVLEENKKLRDEVEKFHRDSLKLFDDSGDMIDIGIKLCQYTNTGQNIERETRRAKISWVNIFQFIANAILDDKNFEQVILEYVSRHIFKDTPANHSCVWHESTVSEIKRKLFAFGLIKYERKEIQSRTTTEIFSKTEWRLTDYGQQQYSIITRHSSVDLEKV